MLKDSLELSKRIAKKISECGGEAYFVGGYVRDKLLKRQITDIDIEIHGIDIEPLREILNSTVKYSEVGKSFGIFSIKDYIIDIAMPRKDVPTGRGHRDFDVFVDPYIGTYNAAKRRDFTINAMMENILTGEVTDHFGGKQDLEARLIRHVDKNTFSQDPLRILRAAQFAARFEFEICEDTILLSKNIDLTVLSKERVSMETKKALLTAKRPSLYFECLKKMGHIFPLFKELAGSKDIWVNSMRCLDNSVKFKEKSKFPLAFMLLSACFFFESENDVSDFIVRNFDEKAVKKYVSNMFNSAKKAYNAAKNREEEYITNEIYDNAVDEAGIIYLLKASYDKSTCECAFLEERLEAYNKLFPDGKITGKDLIDLGFKPGYDFSKILDRAHKMQLCALSKKEIMENLKR